MFDAGELDNLKERAAGLRVRELAGDDVLEQLRSINEARRLLDCAESALLAEADALGTTDIATGMRTAQWLARKVAEGCGEVESLGAFSPPLGTAALPRLQTG